MFSIIIPIKGRLVQLQRTLVASIPQKQAEVVVVDYECPEKTGEWVRKKHPTVTVVGVDGREQFSLTRARNLGAAAALGEWLIFLDADILLNAVVAERLAEIVTPGRFYLATPRDDGFAGFLIVECDAFRRVGGYDPRYVGYGIEDDDLLMALTTAGLTGVTLPAAEIGTHLPHPDTDRVRFYSQRTKREGLRENRTRFAEKWGRTVREAWAAWRWEHLPKLPQPAAPLSFLPQLPRAYPGHRMAMEKLFVPEPDGFNGALVETPVGMLMAYRASPVCACIFMDENLSALPGTHQPLDLWRNDDPRLFLRGAETYLSTSYHGGGFRRERVELRRLFHDGPRVTMKVIGKFETVEDDPHYVRVREKNWAPFTHAGRLLYVHRAYPHRILEVDEGRGAVRLIHEKEWQLPDGWRDEWGRELRLNTPPVLLHCGLFLSTLHTYHGRRYHTWFYTFAAEPPFAVHGISAVPVILPRDAVGVNLRNRRHHCVFVTGLVVREERDEILLTGGNNDASIIVLRFQLSEVLRGIQEIAGDSQAGSRQVTATSARSA